MENIKVEGSQLKKALDMIYSREERMRKLGLIIAEELMKTLNLPILLSNNIPFSLRRYISYCL